MLINYRSLTLNSPTKSYRRRERRERKKQRQQKRRSDVAATKIQALCRGNKGRKLFLKLKRIKWCIDKLAATQSEKQPKCETVFMGKFPVPLHRSPNNRSRDRKKLSDEKTQSPESHNQSPKSPVSADSTTTSQKSHKQPPKHQQSQKLTEILKLRIPIKVHKLMLRDYKNKSLYRKPKSKLSRDTRTHPQKPHNQKLSDTKIASQESHSQLPKSPVLTDSKTESKESHKQLPKHQQQQKSKKIHKLRIREYASKHQQVTVSNTTYFFGSAKQSFLANYEIQRQHILKVKQFSAALQTELLQKIHQAKKDKLDTLYQKHISAIEDIWKSMMKRKYGNENWKLEIRESLVVAASMYIDKALDRESFTLPFSTLKNYQCLMRNILVKTFQLDTSYMYVISQNTTVTAAYSNHMCMIKLLYENLVEETKNMFSLAFGAVNSERTKFFYGNVNCSQIYKVHQKIFENILNFSNVVEAIRSTKTENTKLMDVAIHVVNTIHVSSLSGILNDSVAPTNLEGVLLESRLKLTLRSIDSTTINTENAVRFLSQIQQNMDERGFLLIGYKNHESLHEAIRLNLKNNCFQIEFDVLHREPVTHYLKDTHIVTGKIHGAIKSIKYYISGFFEKPLISISSTKVATIQSRESCMKRIILKKTIFSQSFSFDNEWHRRNCSLSAAILGTFRNKQFTYPFVQKLVAISKNHFMIVELINHLIPLNFSMENSAVNYLQDILMTYAEDTFQSSIKYITDDETNLPEILKMLEKCIKLDRIKLKSCKVLKYEKQNGFFLGDIDVLIQ